MKPGDVVEFKDGLWGIAAPQNLGILVERRRSKGENWAVVHTVLGRKEAKAEHLHRRVFRDRYEGPSHDEAAMRARLSQLLATHAKGGLPEEAESDLERLAEALWSAAHDGRPRRPEELALAHFGTASAQQVRDVRAVLDACRKPGLGAFRYVGPGETWQAWSREERARLQAAWQDLGRLRDALLMVADTPEGRVFVRREGTLRDGVHRSTLDWVQRAMAQYVRWDGVPEAEEVAGIGGLPCVQAFGMDLHRQLGFLAADALGHHANRSSDYVQFLLELGQWTAQDAVTHLMERHVNFEEFFEHVPDARAEAAARELPEPVWPAHPDATPGLVRRDLRQIPCYTIDPPDARDFDDAVGIEPVDGATRLWVHVADVSHYVRPDTTLDRHARKRATSVYLPGRVLPMLPSRLSDHLCSLRDDGDRYALSVALDVDGEGRTVGRSFCASLIRVTKNLHYATALSAAEKGEAPFPDMLALAQRMRRHRRGLGLDTPERRVQVRDDGFEVAVKTPDAMTQMIETFMVAANEAVAQHLDAAGVGLLFRCHGLPEAGKTERFVHQLETLGVKAELHLPKAALPKLRQEETLLDRLRKGGGKVQLFGGGIEPGDDASQREEVTPLPGFARLSPEEQAAWLTPFQEVLQVIRSEADKDRRDVAVLKLLACMGRAYYTAKNDGHFGLGLTHYAHFTSPIRRYPDLVVHRNLKWLLGGAQGEAPHPVPSLEAMSDHCSHQERAAAELERRVRNASLVLAGAGATQEGRGRITGITPQNVFVERDDGVECRVAHRHLAGGPYDVDEWESILYFRSDGPDEAVRARLADRVHVHIHVRDVAGGKTEGRIDRW